MTKAEAIWYLLGEYVVVHEGNEYEKELNDALDMAIETLQSAEINCVHCPHYHETEDDTGVHGHCKGGDDE